MSKHTKGPWGVGTKSNGVSPRHVQILNDNEFLANVYYTNSINETNANATLIAAAPDLLEFAEEVRRTGDTRLASMAIAVIAKAKEKL